MADCYLQLYERLIGAARLPRMLDTFSRPGGPDRQPTGDGLELKDLGPMALAIRRLTSC